MKRRDLKRQHILQAVIILGIVLLLNYISSFLFFRLDLTTDKRYTVSPASREILKQLDEIVYVRIYLEGDLPVGFIRMKKAIRELLDEFRIYSPGNLQYEFIDPAEESDLQLRNRIFRQLYETGLQPTNVQVKEKDGSSSSKVIFPGAILSCSGTDVALNLLKNNPGLSGEQNLQNSIQTLEYEFINMIRNLNSDLVDKIAFLEGHGELDQYQVGDITKELANFYQVDRGSVGGRVGSLDSYKAVIIAKPRLSFPEEDKYVIDQYIMNGGKVIWLVDMVKVSLDSLFMGTTIALYDPLNLEDQLFRYGVRINPGLVKDIQCHVIPVNKGLVGGQDNWQLSPWYYYPLLAPGDNHPIVRGLNMIKIEFGNALDTVGEDPAIKKTILLSSSPYTMVRQVPAEISLKETDVKPNESDYHYSRQPLAVLLEGEFSSAFTNRPVPDVNVFKAKSPSSKMIVISDGDLIRNDVADSPEGPVISALGFDRFTSQQFGNKEFILNAVNYLTDQGGLMELRGREIKLRLLDRKKIGEESLKWKLINAVLPVFLLVLGGLFVLLYRHRIYGR